MSDKVAPFTIYRQLATMGAVQEALEAVIVAQDVAMRDEEVRRILGEAGAKLAILKVDRLLRAIEDGRRALS